MEEKKSSKLSEIKATAFDAVVIMRQLGTPEVQESLTNVKETVSKINEIIQAMQTPEMMKNIENFRIISENFSAASSKMQTTIHDLKETGVIDHTSKLIDTAKRKIDSFGFDNNGINSQDIHNVIVSTNEMFTSIKEMVNEFTETISSSKKSETVSIIQETVKGASNIYKSIA